jgi:predicted MFS family arabinose efflux permease
MKTETNAAAPLPGGYELRVLVLLGLAFGIAYFDRMSMTFLSPMVQADLGLSNEQVALLGSGLSATWALGAYLVGRWSDRVGKRKPFLLAALVVFSLCSVFSGLAWSFGSLLASRMVMGAAEGPFLPICLAILVAASANSRKGINAGIVQNVFGSIIGTALAPFILVRIAEAFDWRMAFYISGLPGLILALVIWRYIREPEAPPAAPVVAQEAAPSLSPFTLLKVRNIRVCSLMSCFAVGSVVIGSIFMPLYLDGPRGLAPLTWANMMTVVGFCPAVGGVLATLLSDRIGRRPALVGFACLMVIAPAALLWFEGSVTMLTGLMFLSWMGLGTFPLFMGVIPAETLGRARAATAMGLVVGVGELSGGVVGPWIAGRLADSYSLAVPLYIQLGLGALAGATALLVTETNPKITGRPVIT